MKFLKEKEAGYDVEGVGFPSIKGCIAMAYQVADGMFGFHNAGNSETKKFDDRAKKWADFVHAHPKGLNPGLALYGVTFARSNERGYSLPAVGNWKAELKTFAARLNYTGAIFGYDLTQHFTGPGKKPSAYVEFLRQSGGYSIFVREWFDDARDGLVKGDYVATADFKHLDWAEATKMCAGVDRTGLTRVYPERLGGNV